MKYFFALYFLIAPLVASAIESREVEGLSPHIRQVWVGGQWPSINPKGYYRFVVTIEDSGGFDNYRYQLFLQWISDEKQKILSTIEVKELSDTRYFFSLPNCLNTHCSKLKLKARFGSDLLKQVQFLIIPTDVGKYEIKKVTL